MSVYTGPEIETNGLVLALDAANPKSYPGTGSTWFDMSGKGYNGTLVNSPTYSPLNGGNFLFDKVNDYVNLGNTLQASTDFTITVWVKNEGSGQGGLLTKGLVNSVDEWGISFGYSNPLLVVCRYRSAGQQLFYSWQGYTSGFHEISYTVKGSVSSQMYIDGNLVAQNTITASPTTNTENLQIGFHGTSYYFSGSIASAKMYNRALSAQEIKQNFNATRSRFSI